MKLSTFRFEIAQVVFEYNYEKDVSIEDSAPTFAFLPLNDRRPDIVNNICFSEWSLYSDFILNREPTVKTRAWSMFSEGVLFHSEDGLPIAYLSSFETFPHVRTVLFSGMLELHPLPICVTAFLLQYYLSTNRLGLIGHGSTLELDKAGYLFVGNSGAGKSTISRILRDELEAKQLSDDRFILRRDDHGGIIAYGNPFDTKIERSSNSYVKISRIFFLEHSPINHCGQIPEEDVVCNLLKIFILPYWDRDLLRWSIDFLGEISLCCRAFFLQFVPDCSIAKYLCGNGCISKAGKEDVL